MQQVSAWCGVTTEPVTSKSRWSSDVTVWRVCDSPGGFVYIDVGHRVLRTCCTAVQAGIRDEAFPRRQQPAIAVVSVSTRGSPDGCISPHTLANLFHELGHAFHHIIGCTPVGAAPCLCKSLVNPLSFSFSRTPPCAPLRSCLRSRVS